VGESVNLISKSNFALWVVEVMKGLWEKKQAKMKKNQSESGEKTERVKEKSETTARRSEQEKADNHVKLQ
jgi:hypothetical protein